MISRSLTLEREFDAYVTIRRFKMVPYYEGI